MPVRGHAGGLAKAEQATLGVEGVHGRRGDHGLDSGDAVDVAHLVNGLVGEQTSIGITLAQVGGLLFRGHLLGKDVDVGRSAAEKLVERRRE